MTPELRQARAGKLTASKASVVMGGLDTKGLADYVKDLAWERVVGITGDYDYQSAAMERGKLIEAEALDWYAFDQDCVIDSDPDRMFIHPDFPTVGATPDATRPGRTIEAKSPLYRAWMDINKSREVPAEYRWQCRWQMWCCGVVISDFVAYHPKKGGIIIPMELEAGYAERMAERVPIVEAMVLKEIEHLNPGFSQSRKAA